MTVLVALTSCDFFSYTARAAKTALEYTPNSHVMIIDDASSGWPEASVIPEPLKFLTRPPYDNRVSFVMFRERFGLTRSWNHAVIAGKNIGAEYTVISNNDVVFTRGWWRALEVNLENFDLVSPVSNAPGPTAKGLQEVEPYIRKHGRPYRVTDEELYLNSVADFLYDKERNNSVEARVNGFCFAAKTENWLKHAYGPGGVFKMYNTHNSKGQKNPTPTMTLMEDEYQHRLYATGGKAAVCPGSFVFHFRSVWRGEKHKQGSWYRPETAETEGV